MSVMRLLTVAISAHRDKPMFMEWLGLRFKSTPMSRALGQCTCVTQAEPALPHAPLAFSPD